MTTGNHQQLMMLQGTNILTLPLLAIYNTKFHHILQKLGENKKSADSQYHHLMTEIHKISSPMDAIEGEQNQVDNALDFVSKDFDEPQECVKQLERTVEIL